MSNLSVKKEVKSSIYFRDYISVPQLFYVEKFLYKGCLQFGENREVNVFLYLRK